MNALVIYDSVYGNTEKIAKTIAKTLPAETKVLSVSQANPADLNKIDLLIMGSPTHGGRPTPAMKEFLDKNPKDALKNIQVTAFDTGIEGKGIGMKILTGLLGYAAPKIAKELQKKGGQLIVPAEGFFVEGKEGPLKTGELERAEKWGKTIFEKKK